MFGTAKTAQAGPLPRRAVIVVAMIVLLAVASHFVADAACLALPAGAVSCAAGVQTGAATGLSALCGWHTGTPLVLLPALVVPLLLLSRARAVRPRASCAQFAPPFQPPIASLTA